MVAAGERVIFQIRLSERFAGDGTAAGDEERVAVVHQLDLGLVFRILFRAAHRAERTQFRGLFPAAGFEVEIREFVVRHFRDFLGLDLHRVGETHPAVEGGREHFQMDLGARILHRLRGFGQRVLTRLGEVLADDVIAHAAAEIVVERGGRRIGEPDVADHVEETDHGGRGLTVSAAQIFFAQPVRILTRIPHQLVDGPEFRSGHGEDLVFGAAERTGRAGLVRYARFHIYPADPELVDVTQILSRDVGQRTREKAAGTVIVFAPDQVFGHFGVFIGPRQPLGVGWTVKRLLVVADVGTEVDADARMDRDRRRDRGEEITEGLDLQLRIFRVDRLGDRIQEDIELCRAERFVGGREHLAVGQRDRLQTFRTFAAGGRVFDHQVDTGIAGRQRRDPFQRAVDECLPHFAVAVTKLHAALGNAFAVDHHVIFGMGLAVYPFRQPESAEVVPAAVFDAHVELGAAGAGVRKDRIRHVVANARQEHFVFLMRVADVAVAAHEAELEFRQIDIVLHVQRQVRIGREHAHLLQRTDPDEIRVLEDQPVDAVDQPARTRRDNVDEPFGDFHRIAVGVFQLLFHFRRDDLLRQRRIGQSEHNGARLPARRQCVHDRDPRGRDHPEIVLQFACRMLDRDGRIRFDHDPADRLPVFGDFDLGSEGRQDHSKHAQRSQQFEFGLLHGCFLFSMLFTIGAFVL